jgi:putative transposase
LDKRLIELSHKIFEEQWGLKISEINTELNHVHILFDGTPQTQLSKLVNNYKTGTSRLLRKEFATLLSKYYWKPVFGSRSYFICSVSERSHKMVEEYIKNQGL